MSTAPAKATPPEKSTRKRRWLRGVRAVALLLVIAAALAFVAFRLWRGPAPETILARLVVPPAPVLGPDEALASFRIAPGFRVELVAAEPMIVDPVALDWDDAGRLYVVEMRGFMGDIEGAGEQSPTGRVVVLTDTDRDGRMDERHVFLEDLVLPRAIAVLPEGVLVGVPPDLLLCRDENANLRCEANEQQRVGRYADEGGNVEHRENGLLPGLDGWIYNAKSSRRFRFRGDELESEPTLFRGQWGIAQDDEGRLYYNHNSGFLYVDTFPADYLFRQPATAAQIQKPGLNVDLAADEKVWGVRVAPGLNRAYQQGALRADGRQNGPTAVSGVAIQRGHQFGDEYKGDAFVPESAGAALARFSIEKTGASLRATHHLYPDPEWQQREFLASSDERFRPVDAKVGPDGAIWVIDMYRGVIQHAHYVSDYLRDYVESQGLEDPGATGRIWRIVREDRPIDHTPAPLASLRDQLRALDHPNGWARDRAQRRLIYEASTTAVAALTRLGDFSSIGRVHALWTLHGLGRLDSARWRAAMQDEDARVRRTALRVGEALLPEAAETFRDAALIALHDSDASVRLQAIFSLGELDLSRRPIDALVELAREASAVEQQAILSSLSGRESEVLGAQLQEWNGKASEAWIRSLATAAFMAAASSSGEGDRSEKDIVDLLDLVEDHRSDRRGLLLLEGIREAQRLPGQRRIVLGEEHPIFAHQDDKTIRQGVATIRRGFTWEGDLNPGGARALTPVEAERRRAGQRLYSATCATCHGAEGRGQAGLAPPLAGSPWVRDADEWLVRIVLQGLHGPIVVDGLEWNSTMPGHGHDPRFDDEAIAGLTTHLRRSWGHADRPIAPETVARIRRETAAHPEAWTARELVALPVEHRLDRYTGVYRVPIVGIEMEVRREHAQLTIGRRDGGQAPLDEIADGLFSGEGMQLRFDSKTEGSPHEAEISFGDQEVRVTRSDQPVPEDVPTN